MLYFCLIYKNNVIRSRSLQQSLYVAYTWEVVIWWATTNSSTRFIMCSFSHLCSRIKLSWCQRPMFRFFSVALVFTGLCIHTHSSWYTISFLRPFLRLGKFHSRPNHKAGKLLLTISSTEIIFFEKYDSYINTSADGYST